jgi:hypothetical protein
MLPNASYFAFMATPKNKTLEIFGAPYNEDGQAKHRPFHSYTMKQAIQEGFILDVLATYTPVSSYYRLVKAAPDDPEFDAKRARKSSVAMWRARPVNPHQGGVDGGPLPGAGGRAAQDRRPGAGHGGDQWH